MALYFKTILHHCSIPISSNHSSLCPHSLPPPKVTCSNYTNFPPPPTPTIHHTPLPKITGLSFISHSNLCHHVSTLCVLIYLFLKLVLNSLASYFPILFTNFTIQCVHSLFLLNSTSTPPVFNLQSVIFEATSGATPPSLPFCCLSSPVRTSSLHATSTRSHSPHNLSIIASRNHATSGARVVHFVYLRFPSS